MELGVAVVYLEEEIELLMKYDIIRKIGDKYQTNIIIFTDDYEKELATKIKPVYEKSAEQIKRKTVRSSSHPGKTGFQRK